jgi:hypothetical protein
MARIEVRENPRGTKRGAMWRIMRFLHKKGEDFTVAQVAMLADTTGAAVLEFVSGLRRVGVVEKVKKHTGRHGSFAFYRFVKDLGPKVPIIRRDWVVYDTNSYTTLTRTPIKEAL